MGRTRYVHRTIVSTEVEVMTVNTDTKEFGNVLVPVQGTYSDITDSKLEKEVKKGFDSLTLADTVMVKITDIHPVTKMYKMLESQFMALAESEVVDGEVFNDGDEE